MTEFKSKMPEGKTPEELYHEYQISRDDIAAPVYSTLKSAAEQASHEDNIESILQRAKVFQAQPTDSSTDTVGAYDSLFTKARGWLFGTASTPNRAWGTAFASLVLAAIALPLTLNSLKQSEIDSQLAYFDDCTQCLNYIQNTSTSTRGTLLGLNRTSPKQRFDARLGRIFADFKVLQSLGHPLDRQDIDAQIKRVKALPSNFFGPNLAMEITKAGATHENIIAAIQNDQKLEASSGVFSAAESLEIANITARRARDEKSNRGIVSSFTEALISFERVAQTPEFQNNHLAQNVLGKLQGLNSKIAQEPDLEKLVTLYTQALQSLGI